MKFLHISDLHFNPKDDGRATRDLREKFSKYVKEKGITDVNEVFFTGDFRHAGNQCHQPEDEVAKNAVEFLREIASCVGVENDRNIHIVPGNHDLSREADTQTNNSILSAIYEKYEKNDGRFEGCVNENVPALDYLRSRFSFFEKCATLLNNRIWTDFGNGMLHRIDSSPDLDSYSILCLNTAIASGHDDFRYKLLIGTDDFDKIMRKANGRLLIVLAHNPLSHLEADEQNTIKNIIRDRETPVLWLSGDVHESRYDNTYNIACVTTGCMIQQNGTEASFVVGDFEKYKGLSIKAHGYVPRHSYWQPEEALSKRIAESIPTSIQPPLSADMPNANNLHELQKRNKFFTGRDINLHSIHQSFHQQEISAINICQTISGLGGIGKTQLAIEYAYRYCGNYKDCIWFVNAETSTTTHNSFVDFAKCMNIKLPQDFKPEELQRAVKACLSEHSQWLIIFDNLEFPDVVKPYLPQTFTGRIIITSRNVGIDFGTPLELGVFAPEESLSFLHRRFSNDGESKMENYKFNDFEECAPKLTERLGHLPLALEQAAAYIKKMGYKISDYLKLLGESSVDAFTDEDAKAMYYENIVNDTWRISFEALSTSAQYVMNLCAYMAPDKIPVAFFVDMREKLPSPLRENLATELKTNRVFGDIKAYSLANGNAYFINIHRLVQEVVRKSHEVDDAEN
jgi:predicted MPP superfamily phosphohydrolase